MEEKKRIDLRIPNCRGFVIENFLTESECQAFIAQSEKQGYVKLEKEFLPNYRYALFSSTVLTKRNNERCVIKSQDIADVFYHKVEPLIVESDIDGIRPYGFGTEGIWKPVTCNEWIKFSKYQVGNFFKPHIDAPHVVHEDKRSIYTLMVFLNDDFTGGLTNFMPLNYDDKVDCFLTALRTSSVDTIRSFSQDCTLGMYGIVKEALKRKINVFSYILQESEIPALGHSAMEIVMRYLLPIKEITQISFPPKYDTPLHIACEKGLSGAVILLLANGAQVRVRNSKGDTPLHKACLNPVLKQIIVELKEADRKAQIVSGGASDDPTILELKNNVGHTPMQILDSVAKEYRSRSEYLLIQKEMQKPIPRKVVLPKLGGRFAEPELTATEQSAPTTTDASSATNQPGDASAPNASHAPALNFPRDSLFSIKPKRGMALIFNHDVNHEGMPVLSGTKYIMRTEIIFERIHATDESWKKDPLFKKCLTLIQEAEEHEKRGEIELSCSKQNQQLIIQANKCCSIQNLNVKDERNYLSDVFVMDVWVLLCRYLSMPSLKNLKSVCLVNKTWSKNLYQFRYPDAFMLEIKTSAFMKDWYNIFKFVFQLKSSQQKRSPGTINTVALDLGTEYLKASYNGKKASMLSVLNRCQMVYYSHNYTPSRGSDDEYQIGHGLPVWSKGTMSYDKLEGVVRTLFRTRMFDNYANTLAFKSHYVVVVEPAGGWGEKERCLVEEVFKGHKIPGWIFVEQPILSILATGKNTGCSLHFGNRSPIISYVENGVVVEWQTIPMNVVVNPKSASPEELPKLKDADLAKNIFEFISKFEASVQNECWKNLVLDGGTLIPLSENLVQCPFHARLLNAIKVHHPLFSGFGQFLFDESSTVSKAEVPVYGGTLFSLLSDFEKRLKDQMKERRGI